MRQILNFAAVTIISPVCFLFFREALGLPSSSAIPLCLVAGMTAFHALANHVGLQRASLRLYRALRRRRCQLRTSEASSAMLMWGTYAALALMTVGQIMSPESVELPGRDVGPKAASSRNAIHVASNAALADGMSPATPLAIDRAAGSRGMNAARRLQRPATAPPGPEQESAFCPRCRDWLKTFLTAISAPGSSRDM
ncbi:hypothetical protein [Panacagrimonas perspica]|uniref:hypothetical protein n=1 Tax=Panacagrimonas perspica TaxID=381431 RepID=UPI001060F74F|nr:hypothetical protein [Panacagrimonas perspica]